jgi:hypothetical protein
MFVEFSPRRSARTVVAQSATFHLSVPRRMQYECSRGSLLGGLVDDVTSVCGRW